MTTIGQYFITDLQSIIALVLKGRLNASMTLRQVLGCAQPLLFEDGPEGYEYSSGGTFFFAKFRNRFFAITAKHCLHNRDYTAIRLMRLSPTKERAFIPYEIVSEIENPGDTYCEWSDLVFIKLDVNALTSSDKTATWFLDCDLLSQQKTSFSIGDGLGTKGYPFCRRDFDYENGTIKTTAVAWSGIYDGPAHEAHLHKFKFSKLLNTDDLNGVSGSPVFKIFQNKHITAYWFAGVILLGTIESQAVYFIDRGVVFRALEILSNEK